MKRFSILLSVLAVGSFAHAAEKVKPAKVEMKDGKGKVAGTLTITNTDHGVKIVGDLKGIPQGTHGFHVHETGTCTAPDFKSAGGHFNPDEKTHGDLSEHPSHNGDMPNVEVGSNGKVHLDLENTKVTLKPDAKNSLRKSGGTAFVLHVKADDYKTQPTGDAGDRYLCGEVK